jgi:Tfp pilus assembly protein FimT
MTLNTQNKSSGFSLVEIMVSAFILVLVVGVTMTSFISILKQHRLIEDTNDLSLTLQQATDQMMRQVVSSPSDIQVLDASGSVVAASGTPQACASGVSIRVAPAENHYVMVVGGTDILDAATNTLGYKNTRTSLTLSSTTPQATTRELIQEGATCPSAAVSTLSTSIFVTTAPSIDASILFNASDPVTLPQTGFGGPRQLTVQAVSSTSLTFTTQLHTTSTTFGVPNGTLIANTRGPRSRFTVVTTASGSLLPGDLVYYPNDSVMTNFKILARNIVPQTTTTPVRNIYRDPSTPASGTDANPFTYNTVTRELIVNLQCLPPGNPVAGRTTIGSRQRIRIRTTPNSL